MTTPRKTTAARKATTAARAETVAKNVFVKQPTPDPLTLQEILDRNLQTLPETTVPLYLDSIGAAEVEALEQELAKLTGGEKQSRMGGDPQARQLAERIVARQEQMAQTRVEFLLRGLPRRKWKDLCEAHPQRKVVAPTPDRAGQPQLVVHDDDAVLGINASTFFDPVVRASILSPAMDDATYERVMDGLTSAQWDKLANAAWMLNRREVGVPFSSRASLTLGS